ncbi:tetratricopeptide repeat protein [Rhodocytophaga aerolata]|uniref:Tetratricopeptide repeat protein n=1 Tax=Rhodocytophaga aerolata TaxID=455078 RepID=A0ABT8RBG1_9BACT|nr:tetratricopeptide repeat protein [Rhodocytophaga aerolata]MDO1448513.1 tetratricopeptide repeat protein [Rhodocytophaga aerolata]
MATNNLIDGENVPDRGSESSSIPSAEGVQDYDLSSTVKPATTLSATVILFILAGIALLVFTRFEHSQSLLYYYDEKEDFSQVLPISLTEQLAAASTTFTSKSDPAHYLQPLYKQLIHKPTNDTLHYYLGVCYYQMDDPVNAIRNFRTVMRQPQSVWEQKAQFRLGLSLLKAEKSAEAKVLFEKISRQPHHPYREKAASILQEKEFFKR